MPLGFVQRFGVLGGSFNPVHVGHLSIAQQILDAHRLEKVFLIPASVSPFKQDDPDLAPAADRLTMCRLAVQNLKGLDVSALELNRPPPSYTVDTARALRAAYGPKAEIRLILGSDALAELPAWKEAKELMELCDFAVALRRNTPLNEELWEQVRAGLGEAAADKLRSAVTRVEPVDVSSTLIRKLLRDGETIPGYLRRPVEDYIRGKGLYGAPRTPRRVSRIAHN
jgi:nicotinate-nucleotide adenylyltransferase